MIESGLSGLPLLDGAIASVIALAMVLSWIAIGGAFVPNLPRDDEVAAPAAVLIGSAVVAFFLAIAAALGKPFIGVILIESFAAIVLVARARDVIQIVSPVLAPLAQLSRSVVAAVAAAMVASVLWLNAIAPPRSADAMRYHLAHIRQILNEGHWVAISDFHYALPFGWTLHFLPFEILRLPQGSQLLGVAIYFFVVAAFARFLQNSNRSTLSKAAAAAFFVHPAVLRSFWEAGADGYSLLVVSAVTLLLCRVRKLGGREAVLLGFVSWVGIQSRYQLVAVGIASVVVLLLSLTGRGWRAWLIPGYLIGAVNAFALASPFYVMNALAFRNPVWPLLMSRSDAENSYANFVAWSYGLSLRGDYTVSAVAQAMLTLFSTRFLMPIGLIVPLLILATAIFGRRDAKPIAFFGVSFLVLWLAMQPLLYPRFVLLMVPVAALCTILVLDDDRKTENSRLKLLAFPVVVAALAAQIAILPIFARDAARYAFTGDAWQYHRYTWFYPVYRWADRTLPKDARALVAVSSAHTYYLDRRYRRVDPWVGGQIDWMHTSGLSLVDLMQRRGYAYMIYEDRDWSDYRGGREMKRAVSEAIASGKLKPIRKFDERLYTSRLSRKSRPTRVYVLQRTG
jgi:hypothetical protein